MGMQKCQGQQSVYKYSPLILYLQYLFQRKQVKTIVCQMNLRKEGKSTSFKRPSSCRKSRKAGKYKRWSKQENFLYAKFLFDNIECFESQFSKRSAQVFKKLSQVIHTKNKIQCKSHHQKMMDSYKDLKTIIDRFLNSGGEKLEESSGPSSQESPDPFFEIESQIMQMNLTPSLSSESTIPEFMSLSDSQDRYISSLLSL